MGSTICFGGSLRDVPVPVVLHRIVQSRGKGTLTLSRPAERIRLFFVDGELRAANSTRAGMRVGDTLLVHGVVPEEEFEEALRSTGGGRGGRIGRVLVEKGLVSQEVLDAQVRRQFEEIFYSCFSWRDGEFAFLPSRGRLDSDVALELPTAALIIEGVRRMPDEQRGLEVLGDPAGFGRATRLASRLESLRLSSEEAYFLSLCDGTTRLRDILRLGRSRAEASQTLYTLLACGLIEFIPDSDRARPAAGEAPDDLPFLPPADEHDTSSPEERARADCAEARSCFEQGDFYRAIVLLQDAVHLFPENAEYRFRLAGALSCNPLWRRRALAHYREALRIEPFREDLLWELAQLLLAEGKFRAAHEIAERLVAHHPDRPSNRDLLLRCRAAVLGQADPAAPIDRDHGAAPSERAPRPERPG
jgi:Tfp pilus assembly protein PilF